MQKLAPWLFTEAARLQLEKEGRLGAFITLASPDNTHRLVTVALHMQRPTEHQRLFGTHDRATQPPPPNKHGGIG